MSPDHVDALPSEQERHKRLCELNGQQLFVHGWIYDLSDGLLRDLDITDSQ